VQQDPAGSQHRRHQQKRCDDPVPRRPRPHRRDGNDVAEVRQRHAGRGQHPTEAHHDCDDHGTAPEHPGDMTGTGAERAPT
jgi:hypothetical protein